MSDFRNIKTFIKMKRYSCGMMKPITLLLLEYMVFYSTKKEQPV